MKESDTDNAAELDISVFEIPPAAAYFETIQQLQKISAKLDVLITNQAIILSSLRDSNVEQQVNESHRMVAEKYEENLLKYFEATDIDLESLRNTIHPDDRVKEQ